MSEVQTKLLLAQIDVPVRVISINRHRRSVTLEVAGERVTLRAGDEAVVHAEARFERT